MSDDFFRDHAELSRRAFLRAGAAGAAACGLLPWMASAQEERPEALRRAIERLEYLTPQQEFRTIARGNPRPSSLSQKKKREAGLTRETWALEVIPDPEQASKVGNPLTKAAGNALDFEGLMRMARQRAVSFPKIMTCNNIARPLGMGIWEGVPLRNVVWLAKPSPQVRRVSYYGYHNDDPKQMFRSSLPVGRVLEDPFGLPPIILCFKLNGRWLSSRRGGPVRIVVPEFYGFKSIKWVTTVVLTPLSHANDTYAKSGNDIDSWLKTFAALISLPNPAPARVPLPVTGLAQVGISGLSKVQYAITPADTPLPKHDPLLHRLGWKDAEILGPPTRWGGDLPQEKLPTNLLGFDPKTSRPKSWPMRLTMAHWTVLVPGLRPGQYDFRCRSIDANGIAQPMPRPFQKSGRNRIAETRFEVRS